MDQDKYGVAGIVDRLISYLKRFSCYWQARKVRHGKKLEEIATRDKQIKHRESS